MYGGSSTYSGRSRRPDKFTLLRICNPEYSSERGPIISCRRSRGIIDPIGLPSLSAAGRLIVDFNTLILFSVCTLSQKCFQKFLLLNRIGFELRKQIECKKKCCQQDSLKHFTLRKIQILRKN